MTETAPAPMAADTSGGDGIDPSIAAVLPMEAVEALRKTKQPSRKPKPAAEAVAPVVADAAEATTATTTAAETAPEPADIATEAEPDQDTIIDLSAEPEQTEATTSSDDDDHTISEEELSTLPDGFRKKYRTKDAENKRLRTRSQEAEKERDTLKVELEKARASAGQSLAGNEFAGFSPEHTAEVAAWVDVGADLQRRMNRINLLNAKGQEVPDELWKVELPNGNTVELDDALVERAAKWESQAKDWIKHNQTLAEDKKSATALHGKLKAYDGYEAALEALRSNNPGRETLLSKAALFDMIVAKKARITIPSAVKAAPATKGASASRAPAPSALPAMPGGAAISAPNHGSSSTSAERARLMVLATKGDTEALERALLLPKS